MRRVSRIIITSTLLAIACCSLCGCDSVVDSPTDFIEDETYDDGYDDGYQDGYSEGYDKCLRENGYIEEELHSFKIAIAELMYDKKYDVVKELLGYNKEGVEDALELEFGTSDLPAIEMFVQEYHKTVAGVCEICNKKVYLNELGYIPKGMKCAHQQCVSKYYAQNDD